MKTLKIQSHFPYSTSIQTCYDITVYVQEKPTSTYDTKQSIDHSEENMWVPISWLFRSLPEHVFKPTCSSLVIKLPKRTNYGSHVRYGYRLN